MKMNDESTLRIAGCFFDRDLEETVQNAENNLEEMEQHLDIFYAEKFGRKMDIFDCEFNMKANCATHKLK